MVHRAITAQCSRDAQKDAVSLAEDDYLRTLDAITVRLEKTRIPREANSDGEVGSKKKIESDDVDRKDYYPNENSPDGD